MSRVSKPDTIAYLNDTVLGAFVHVAPSETLNHLLRYLSTWGGSDKFFMVIQYTLKLVVPFLNFRARLQYRAGKRVGPTSNAASAYSKFAGIISDSRTLWRMWGLLEIVQWLISLERNPQPTRKLLTIERLQGWSMLAYYPLEHLSYLLSHGVLPSTIPSPFSVFSKVKRYIKLDANRLALWSCRFWALYVLLQFARLKEDQKLLEARQRSLRKGKGTSLTAEERRDMRQRWDMFRSEFLTNLAYLPLTIHWSLETGLFKNETWINIFGFIAAVTSFRSGWKATALPPPGRPESDEKVESSEENTKAFEVAAYDASSL
ncbi:hypothetical protein M378DRAFT_159548 [Amanita muscaria Koide BX008]|uniref:Uncharacterized protein n=1 Tax=Amanita muscaria (strain Koide BX008) TaxID=946122 RepID=A0A0C2XE15_AMAMK|nr:hypothetical protein M378DRAFT_159548 [Amanita muscaria Koide BX008]